MSDLDLDTSGSHRSDDHKGHGCLPLLVALLVIAALAGFAYVKGVDLVKRALDSTSSPSDYSGQGHGKVTIEVKGGESASDIAKTLAHADVVKSADAFVKAATDNPDSTAIQVGFYALRKQMSADSALKRLLNPAAQIHDTVTVPEGLRVDQTLALLADKTDFSAKQLQAAYDRTAALGLPSYAHNNAEGFLYPATYEVAPNMTAADLLATMVDQFGQEADTVHLEDRANALGIDPYDAVVVASLVQGEASRVEDMPKVASVAYNRLDKGMLLQFDSTNKYAVDGLGVPAPGGNIIEIDSPYNSYQHTGLPPTPIDSPGADALDAALNPASGGLLYFVTVNLRTGETKFAETFAEHQRNEAEYHQYCTTSDAC
ncbi:MAG: endolytic transglycosylase MltG [Nocardioidaceae bacterium]